ncbi:MAG: carbohydrate porin [Methylophaga sp.]|nr:carbohydrate porin [Methylophaga sp.]
MKRLTLTLLIAAALTPMSAVLADDLGDLKAEIAQMRAEYEQRIQQLEQRLTQAENTTNDVREEVAIVKSTPIPITHSNNSFNPAISMVLNGQFSSYSNPTGNYTLNGFSMQNGAGLATEGLSLGESEITLSASIDQLLFGQMTIALADDGAGVEEAFIETQGLDNGLTVRAGRFYSPIGYLNERHVHVWNFADAPLIYRGLFGDQMATDGLKLSYILPTDQLVEIGGTIGSGNQYPSNGSHSGIGDWLVFAKTGGDIGISHSWQASVAHWQSSPKDRSIGDMNLPSPVTFNGDTDISNLSLIYKWAPNGNPTQQNLTLLGEYFYSHDTGTLNNIPTTAIYNGKQYGGYVEGMYQFMPRWRAGMRYDRLSSSINASNVGLLNAANLDLTSFHPQRYSLMLEWLPSNFSRLRVQINEDKSSRNNDTQLFLQYTVNIGAHGAHSY